ncbi:MAG: hypothetical protein MK095_02800 [Phycisphaerales bacterium]|nr:hypothetical protein [Phycisphaerales bacterium]
MTALFAQVATTAPNDAALAWGMILLAASIILLFLELFLPSGGIIAICAGVTSIGSLVAFFTYSTEAGFVALVLYVIFGPLLLWFGFKWWASSSMGRRMILGAENDPMDQTPEEAFAASNAAQQERARYLDELLHLEGITETPLRPVGTVRLSNGERHEALAENGVIDAKINIRVVDVQDNQLKVRAM